MKGAVVRVDTRREAPKGGQAVLPPTSERTHPGAYSREKCAMGAKLLTHVPCSWPLRAPRSLFASKEVLGRSASLIIFEMPIPMHRRLVTPVHW